MGTVSRQSQHLTSGRDRIIHFQVFFIQIPASPEFRGAGKNGKVPQGSKEIVGALAKRIIIQGRTLGKQKEVKYRWITMVYWGVQQHRDTWAAKGHLRLTTNDKIVSRPHQLVGLGSYISQEQLRNKVTLNIQIRCVQLLAETSGASRESGNNQEERLHDSYMKSS